MSKRGQDDDTAAAAPACTLLCVCVWNRKHLTTRARQPLPGFHANHEGCSRWSMLSLAPYSVTIASERALTLSPSLPLPLPLSRTLLQLAVGARQRREAACCAAEVITHSDLQTKVSTQTFTYSAQFACFYFFVLYSL